MTIRVFLLDDHEMVREGIRNFLEIDDDIEVVGEAATVAEALTRIPLSPTSRSWTCVWMTGVGLRSVAKFGPAIPKSPV